MSIGVGGFGIDSAVGIAGSTSEPSVFALSIAAS